MTDKNVGDGREEPLLVRPFLLHDAAQPDDSATVGEPRSEAGAPDVREPSAQTWPASAAGREFETRRADAGAADLTTILSLDRVRPRRRVRPAHRRLMVLISVAAAVLLGAAAAGYAAFGGALRPAAPGALHGAPLPAVSGPRSAGGMPAQPGPVTAPGSTRWPGAADPRHTGGGGETSSAPAITPFPRVSGSFTTLPTVTPSAESGTPVMAPAPEGSTATPEPGATGAPAARVAERTGVVQGQNSMCLDLNNSLTVEDNYVQAYQCNGTGAQSWTLAADGTLQVLGMCAQPADDGTVLVSTCDGEAAEKWTASGQALVNKANDACLTDPSGGTQPGTVVTITACNGSAQQTWSLP